jgi:hypothetical protein
MTYGLSAMSGGGSALENAPISGSEIKTELENMVKGGMSEVDAARKIAEKYTPRMQAQGGEEYEHFFTNPKYKLGGSRMKQAGSLVKGLGIKGGKHLAGTAIGLLSFEALANLLHGSGATTEAPQFGNSQDQIMSMLAQSNQSGRPTTSAMRDELESMRSMVAGQEKMNSFGYTPGGAGVRGDLDALIAGKESELDSMAHREPISIAQALAAKGLWKPRNRPSMQELM